MKKFSFSCLAALTVLFVSTVAFAQPKGQPKADPECDPKIVCAPKETPPPKPFVLMCGEGTTRPGQPPLGLHCECIDTLKTTLVTGKLDYGGKEEKCVPNKDVIDSLYALYLQLETDKTNAKDVYIRDEIDKMLKEIWDYIHNLPSRIEVNTLIDRIAILEGRMDKLEQRVDKLSDSIVNIFVGIGGEYTLKGPDAAGGDVHGVVIVEGNVTKVVGVYGEVEGGYQSARDTGDGYEVGGGAGVAFTLTNYVRLLVGPEFRQFGRVHAAENGAIGNGTSYAIGGQVRLIANATDWLAFSPYIGGGGGESSGFHGGDVNDFYTQKSGSFWVGLDLLISTGIGTR